MNFDTEKRVIDEQKYWFDFFNHAQTRQHIISDSFVTTQIQVAGFIIAFLSILAFQETNFSKNWVALILAFLLCSLICGIFCIFQKSSFWVETGNLYFDVFQKYIDLRKGRGNLTIEELDSYISGRSNNAKRQSPFLFWVLQSLFLFCAILMLIFLIGFFS